jgi:phosphonoacetaldehyde hydrolase
MRGDSTPSRDGLAAVVFDWAGTVADFGCQAPMSAFRSVFEHEGVTISVAEARAPMGLPKRDHIRAIGYQPRVAKVWQDVHGHAFGDADIDRLYETYTPLNRDAVAQHADLVPGVAELVRSLRRNGLAIGSTTGYSRDIIRPLVALAAQQGFEPDNIVCSDDVPLSRPSPMGLYRTMLDLCIWPAWRVVKVDDTVPGLLEGRHAGCWTVGVTASGNEVGLTLEQWQALDDTERGRARARAADRLSQARPHYTVDTVAALPDVLAVIERRLAAGERPGV